MKNIFGLIAVSVLTACGGGGGTDKTAHAGRPASSATGYAKEGDKLKTGSEFTLTGVPRFVWKKTGEDYKISREFSNIKFKQIKFDETGGTNSIMQITLDEKDYILTYNGQSDRFEFNGLYESADAVKVFRDEYDYVTAVGYSFSDYSDFLNHNQIGFNGGYFTAGFNTAPVMIAARRDKARYNGDAQIAIRYLPGYDAFPSGTSQFNVDFGAGTITGAIVFDPITETTTYDEFLAPKITMELPSTKIEGNAFDGDLTVVMLGNNPKNITFSKAELDGQFFGPQGEELGANIWGEGKADGQDLLFQGVTVAERESSGLLSAPLLNEPTLEK